VLASQQAIAASATAFLTQLSTPASAIPWLTAAVAGAAWGRAAAESVAATAQAITNHMAVLASFERKKQEWQLSRDLARQDVAIGNQQIRIAQDRVRVATQEGVIARLDADHAQQAVDFLSTKFTNVELYDWMAGVLQSVYRYFLQQATSTAQLAASQLAFERQTQPPPYIQANYWRPPESGAVQTNAASAPDRKGLTGSARLLQDITQLDQYAFDTNRRKLQLAKTLSLQQLLPIEFDRFRETGVLTFSTPMELFDRDFPGHYLRLVKRVRTSVIALVPPILGIKATLSSSRLTRAVTGGDLFQTVRIQRGPESVALTSPRDATGVFELDTQPEMLGFFEGIGVDGFWEFRMPRASNPFDYKTIADVLVTIEYTALSSPDYASAVKQRLPRTTSADRSYSFRNDFSDAWYDLHNPDTTATPLTVSFRIEAADFPPNLDDVRTAHVALFFGRRDGINAEIAVDLMTLKPDGETGFVGGAGLTDQGLISTRRGNAGSWLAMIGKSPVGDWQLALPDNARSRALFSEDQVQDILLVVTYSGRLPEWPS
jgi:hypothetical protein